MQSSGFELVLNSYVDMEEGDSYVSLQKLWREACGSF